MSDRNFDPSIKEEVAPLAPNSPEYAEMQFLFNTLFNESSVLINPNDLIVYEIEKAYSIKNLYISLNFEKREKSEISSYGWFESPNKDNMEDRKIDEQVMNFRTKDFELANNEIKVSAPNIKEDRFLIIICKFIVGKSDIIFQDVEISKEDKIKYKENYDTIVRIMSKTNNKQNTHIYNVLREENIELLYLIKAKKGEFQSQLIECSKLSCPNNELINEPNKKELGGDKKMYYCLLKEDYLCETCHDEHHQSEIKYGNFDVKRCELKSWLNLPGECPNKEFHPNKKSFDVEYFCTDCLKGICSYCKVYGSEKHPELHLLTDIFNKSKKRDDEKNKCDSKIKKMNQSINPKFDNYKKSANSLKSEVYNIFFNLKDTINNKFTEEGKKIICICYQLNLLKDNLMFYHKAYLNKENLCLTHNLKQELFWTKKTHLEHLLYLISLKDNIKTKYLTNQDEFHRIIGEKKNEVDKKINNEFGLSKPTEIIKEVKQENDENILTYESFIGLTRPEQND
jgi:hypothetical protein